MIYPRFFAFAAAILVASMVAINLISIRAQAEAIQLATVLPKLQAIHEDAQTLLIKNSELKAKILLGLQAQNEAKLKKVKEAKLANSASTNAKPTSSSQQQQQSQSKPTMDSSKLSDHNNSTSIDYTELEEFNKWVDVNLDYAVKNTQASIESFKEEAQQTNGMVDYSDQAIKDGIEGVKYWQAAVIFQDKTLKEEKLDQVPF